MRSLSLFASAILAAASGFLCAQVAPVRAPSEITIGRQTFFDFGPPFDYYEVIQLRAKGNIVQAQRVFLTPAAGCFQPAKAEFSQAILKISMADLLGGVDPCRISPKQIKKELRRRKKFHVFSGANISMQLECNGAPRVLSSAVLDRDLFAKNPQTPQVTSWTMQLLAKVDQALGPGAWDKPMFSPREEDTATPSAHFRNALEDAVADGRFDGLFPGVTDRVSEIYEDSLKPAPSPTVLVQSSPTMPDSYVAPVYPPIAKAARVEGEVSFKLTVGQECRPQNVEIVSGPKLLEQATIDAVKQWKFCKAPNGGEVQGTVQFRLNCPVTLKTSVSQR